MFPTTINPTPPSFIAMFPATKEEVSMRNTIIAASIALLPSFADAQQRPPVGHLPFYSCGPTEGMEQTLTEKYGEAAVYGGTSSPIHLDRFWVNEETGSWSNTRTNINSGMTCILTSGQNARRLEVVLGQPT